MLATGVAAATMAATSQVFAQQTEQSGNAKFYEKGSVRIRYDEAGSGFPLLLIAGGGLNSVMAGLATSPFNPIEEFKGEYRCVFADLRNANPGQSSGPLEVDRPWDSYTDDHLGLMDHLGIDKFMVLGFCIGGPFIWNLLKRAPDRVVAAVPAQPVGFRPEMPTVLYDNGMTRFCAQLPDARPHPSRRHPCASLRRRHGMRDARAQGRSQHLSVEGTQGADSAGGAPSTFLPSGTSTGFCLNTRASGRAVGLRRSVLQEVSSTTGLRGD
jgi:pimeloyl-ACP methyl ester carboxylesterase